MGNHIHWKMSYSVLILKQSEHLKSEKGKDMANFTGLSDSGVIARIEYQAPTGQNYDNPGTIWIDVANDDIYIAGDTAAGLQTWIPCGGGSGNVTITGGSLTVTAGSVTFGAFGKGVLFSSAAGLLSSAAGTNGQTIIGKTGDSPLWGTITCPDGSIGIALGANTIALTATGATASTFPTNGAVVTPLAGATTIVGGNANIVTDGAVANTVTINLSPSVSLVGKLTAGNDLEMTTGTCLIASDDNAVNAIYLHANGGVNETIHLYSQLGTTASSVNLESLVGGITIGAGTALALTANTASTITVTNNSLALATGTGALNLGADAAAHTVTVGSIVGAARTILQSGTGDLALTSTDAITISPTAILDINAGGAIDLQTTGALVNIATDAVAATVTIGNSTGVSSVVIDTGTGNLDLGVTATAHATRLGSTNTTSTTTVQAGTGGITLGAAGKVAVTPATDSQAGATVTINNRVGKGTFTGLTTAAGAEAILTVTNSVCTTSSAILCSIASATSGADVMLQIQHIELIAGSFKVYFVNAGAAALATDIILTFWLI